MNAIAEIDKAGRVVVPKKLRDALQLVPGTRLVLKQQGAMITLQAERPARGLYRKDGMLVYDTGRPAPADAMNWIDDDRDERALELMGQCPAE